LDRVPGVAVVGALAEAVRRDRRPVGKDNPFRRAEALAADMVERWFDAWRDVRDAWTELAFFGLYGTPFMHWIGRTHSFHRTLKDKEELRYLPEVRSALANMARGGIPEAVIRMLALVAEDRGAIRGSRVERSTVAFNHAKPFADIDLERRTEIIREQTLVVQFDRDGAINTLVDLVPDMDSRAIALAIVDHVIGPEEFPDDPAIETLEILRDALEIPRLRFSLEPEEPAPPEPKTPPKTTEAA
jgi:hypothetical protein